MSEDLGEIRFLGDLQRLEVKPGDKFVLKVPEWMSDMAILRLREEWRRVMGDVPLLILDAEMQLGVVGEADALDLRTHVSGDGE